MLLLPPSSSPLPPPVRPSAPALSKPKALRRSLERYLGESPFSLMSLKAQRKMVSMEHE